MRRFSNILFLTTILAFTTNCYAETLYIFYPVTVRSHILQNKMRDACPDIEIKLFGKNRDFTKAVKTTPPDAVLSKQFVLKQLNNFEIKLSGVNKGNTVEPYVLLSVDKNIDINTINSTSLGVIDYLGRQGMKDLISNFFPKPPKLKRTTKVEDLLPLLTFNMADSIFISKSQVKYFQKISNMNFVVTNLSNVNIGIAGLAVKKGGTATLTINSFKGLNNEILSMLGVEGWK